jgi:hypothetical protein
MQRQGGLFGPTPQELQMGLMEQQQQADQQAAQQWGRQNLGQQISTGAYGSALSFGRGLQNLGQQTGVLPQDPRLDEARRLMGIKKEIMDSGIDPQNIDEFYPALISKMVSGGMIDKATALQKDYQSISNTQDAIQARRDAAAAKQREEALPGLKYVGSLIKGLEKNPENAALVHQYANSITEVTPTGNLEILKDLEQKISGVKLRHVGDDGTTGLPVWQPEDASEPAFYRDAQGKKVISTTGLRDKAPKISTSTSVTQAPDIIKALADFDKAVDDPTKVLEASKMGKNFLNEAVTGKNPGGYEGARTLLARAIGEGKLSNADIERIGVTPALVDGFKDFLSKKFTGVPTQQQLGQMFALFSLLENGAATRINSFSNRAREAGKEVGFRGDVNTYFPQAPRYVPPQPTPQAPTAPTQGKPTLRWDATQGKLVPIGQ